MNSTNQRIDGTNQRTDHLYEVLVKQEDYHKLESRVKHLEDELSELKNQSGG